MALRSLPSAIAFKVTAEDEGSFRDFELELQNISGKSQTIMVGPLPANATAFLPDGQDSIRLAPGMSTTVQVIIETTAKAAEEQLQFDIVNSEPFFVPISIQEPHADVHVQDSVNFGEVIEDGEVHTHQLHLRNDGDAAGEWAFDLREAPAHVKLTPASGTIEGNGDQQHVRLDFAANGPPGETTLSIPLIVNGQHTRTVHVQGKVIRQSLQLLKVGTNQPLDFVDVGQFYYGTTRVVKATIFNDRPCETQYFFETVSSAVWAYTANGREECLLCDEPSVSIEPAEGHLMPQEKLVVTITFSPKLKGKAREFGQAYACRRDFEYVTALRAVNADLEATMRLVSAAVIPQYDVSTHTLDFGETYLGESKTQKVTVSNKSQQLPLSFEVESLAHFVCEPSRGLLLAGQSVEIVVHFTPQQIGNLVRKLKVQLGHKTSTCAIKLTGSGVMLAFEDIHALKVARKTAHETGPNAVPFKGPLRKSTIGRGKRLDQSRSTIFDPPKRPNSPSRLKPLKARNTTLPAELKPSELRKIEFSPGTTLDFGEIAEGTMNTMVVSISNPLDVPIELSVACSRAELSQTTICSRLDPGQSGNLQLILTNVTGSTPRRLLVPMTVIVNKTHERRLSIRAQVVAYQIGVEPEVVTILPGTVVHNQKPASTCTLVNPFGRSARFKWSCDGSNTAFSMVPAEGEIAPHSKLRVQILLNPNATSTKPCTMTLKVEDCDIDSSVVCKASFKGSNCKFPESRTLLGALIMHAVNTREAILYNDGATDAFYNVTVVESKRAAVAVSPEVGRVPAGGKQHLCLDVTPHSVGKFEASLKVDIKGRTALRHILTGKVEPPALAFSKKTFDLAHVYVGQEVETNFTITNSSKSPSTVQLDLSELPNGSVTLLQEAEDSLLSDDEAWDDDFSATLPAESTQEFVLKIKPAQVAALRLTVPISVGTEPFDQLTVTATVLKAPITVSNVDIRINIEGEEAGLAASTISNISNQHQHLQLDLNDLVDSPLALLNDHDEAIQDHVWSFDLAAGEERELNFALLAHQDVRTTLRVPVYLSTHNRPIAVLSVSEGHAPMVVLPSLPLLDFGCLTPNMTWRGSMYLESGSDHSSTVKLAARASLPGGQVHATFPTSNQLGRNRIELAVEILAETTGILEGKIELYDAENPGSQVLAVVKLDGICDTSVLSQLNNFQHAGEGFDAAESHLVQYMQQYGTSKSHPIESPLTFKERCGWLAVDIITFVSRAAIPGLPLTRPLTYSEDQSRHMLSLALEFVQQHGGRLPTSLTAESLRSGNGFTQRKMWVRLLAQVMRIFVLGQPPLWYWDQSSKAPLVLEQAEIQVVQWYCQLSQQPWTLSYDSLLEDLTPLGRVLEGFIPQLAEALEDMIVAARSLDERRHNAIVIVEALNKLQISLNIDCDLLLNPTKLFTLVLLHSLRCCLPQCQQTLSSVNLHGTVGAGVSNSIKLKNPNKYTLVFRLTTLAETSLSFPATVQVPGGASVSVPFELTPTLEQNFESLVYVAINRQGSALQQLAHIRVSVSARLRAAATLLNLNTSCYELVERVATIPAADILQDGRYTVSVREQGENDGIRYPSIWSHTDALDLQDGQPGKVPMSFLPTRLGQHDVQLILQHVATGTQLCYQISGKSAPAAPNAVLHWNCQLSKPKAEGIDIPFINSARRLAFSTISKATAGKTNVSARQSHSAGDKLNAIALKARITGCPQASCPDDVVLTSGQDADTAVTTLPITFTPVAVGSYTFTVTLQGSGDTRVFEVHADVCDGSHSNSACKAAPDVPVNVAASQYNPCSTARAYDVEVSGDACFVLLTSASITVEPQSEGQCLVQFQSSTKGTFTGTLTIIDKLSQATSTVQLHGTCQLERSTAPASATSSHHRMPVQLPEVTPFAPLESACDEPDDSDGLESASGSPTPLVDLGWQLREEPPMVVVGATEAFGCTIFNGTLQERRVRCSIEGSAFALIKPKRGLLKIGVHQEREIVVAVTPTAMMETTARLLVHDVDSDELLFEDQLACLPMPSRSNPTRTIFGVEGETSTLQLSLKLHDVASKARLQDFALELEGSLTQAIVEAVITKVTNGSAVIDIVTASDCTDGVYEGQLVVSSSEILFWMYPARVVVTSKPSEQLELIAADLTTPVVDTITLQLPPTREHAGGFHLEIHPAVKGLQCQLKVEEETMQLFVRYDPRASPGAIRTTLSVMAHDLVVYRLAIGCAPPGLASSNACF